jgi:hypothetical protein
MNRTTNSQAANSANTDQVDYFNLHTQGCGYLSRIREVKVGRGGKERFTACAISALRGACDAPDYTYLDLRVSGETAEGLVWDALADVEAGKKVFLVFRIGDIFASDPYEVDEKNRETRQLTGRKVWRSSIKGRLLFISHIQVDGVTVYVAPEAGSEQRQAPTPQGEGHGDDEQHGPDDRSQDDQFHGSERQQA